MQKFGRPGFILAESGQKTLKVGIYNMGVDSERQKTSHQVPFSRTQQANFPARSPHHFFMLNVNQGNYEYQLFKAFGLTWTKVESRSSDCEANVLTTRPPCW